MSKFRYVHILQANYGYGHGWEDEVEDEDHNVIRGHLRKYQLNAGQYNYRVIKRREPNNT